jgi:hypothetical protein
MNETQTEALSVKQEAGFAVILGVLTLPRLSELGFGTPATLRQQIENGNLPTRLLAGCYWLSIEEVEVAVSRDRHAPESKIAVVFAQHAQKARSDASRAGAIAELNAAAERMAAAGPYYSAADALAMLVPAAERLCVATRPMSDERRARAAFRKGGAFR